MNFKGKEMNKRMEKVLSVTVNNTVDSKYIENEFVELNKLLNDGWLISSRDIINSNIISVFTIIYTLSKDLDLKTKG